jgi:hypothetical protein
MSKNTPITARVSTGLFNKKKGVTEPLLNVGKAGVHGNNQTRDIPSPSKIKGYAMKSSPFKQKMIDGKPVEVEIKSAGELITQQGKKIYDDVRDTGKSLKGLTQDQLDWRANEIEKLGGIDNYHIKYGSKKGKKTGAKVDTGKREPDTTTQGPDKKINLKDFEVEGKRGMVESWEAGSQARRMKKLSDDISDSQKKIGRYQSRLAKHTGKDGKALKGHERRFRNATANLAESTRNMKASQGQYDVYSKGVSRGASGYRGGTFNVTEEATKKSLGTPKEQIAFEQRQSTPEDVVTKKNPNEVTSTNKKSNKFFKKTTPLKMKYFK